MNDWWERITNEIKRLEKNLRQGEFIEVLS